MSKFQLGDLFMVDSQKGGAKIVKYLMQSPTIWHWGLGKILGIFNKKWKEEFISEVRMYHVGLIVNESQVIEQQWKVEYAEIEKSLLSKDKYVVWRYRKLTENQATLIKSIAIDSLGETYDLKLIAGKTLTWLTGIPWFSRHIETPNKEICITFGAMLYFKAVGYTWERLSWSELTTDIIDDFNRSHPEDWELVDSKGV